MTTFTTEDLYEAMNAYELAYHVDMWGQDLLALNMKGGVPCILGAKMLRKQADELDKVIPKLVKANGIIENLRIRIADLEAQVYGGTTK